jgi:hypothetical protein
MASRASMASPRWADNHGGFGCTGGAARPRSQVPDPCFVCAVTLFFVLLVPSFMFLSASYESVLASVHSMHVNGRVWFRTLTPPKLIFTCFYGCTMLSNRNSEVLDRTLFCSVLEFGPVPTGPKSSLTSRKFDPKKRPPKAAEGKFEIWPLTPSRPCSYTPEQDRASARPPSVR